VKELPRVAAGFEVPENSKRESAQELPTRQQIEAPDSWVLA
jgi:hypothetical protein